MTTALWANLASPTDNCSSEQLAQVAAAGERAPVFSTVEGRSCGWVTDYAMRGGELWGLLELDDATQPFARMAALIVASGGRTKLLGVLASNLSRERLRTIISTRGSRHGTTC